MYFFSFLIPLGEQQQIKLTKSKKFIAIYYCESYYIVMRLFYFVINNK